MKHKIYINGQEYDCNGLKVQTLTTPDDYEVNGFDSSVNDGLTISFKVSQKSARALSRLFKTHKKPEQNSHGEIYQLKGGGINEQRKIRTTLRKRKRITKSYCTRSRTNSRRS